MGDVSRIALPELPKAAFGPDLSGLALRIRRDAQTPGPTDWYRLGDGALGVRSTDEGFRLRFADLLHECSLPDAEVPPDLAVRCTVQSADPSSFALASFEDPEPLDPVAFALALFGERGLVAQPSLDGAWYLLGVPGGGAACLAVRGEEVLIDRRGSWQGLLANLAINRLLRLQRGLLFFHAASIAMGAAGMLIAGPKGAGKTTLALAMASRGHGFLGDEIAALRIATRELVPFRRAVSIRPGPRGLAVEQALATRAPAVEVYPDGTPRTRANVSELFPGSRARTCPLRQVVVLRSRAERPRLEPLPGRHEDLGLLAPLESVLWGVSRPLRAMQLLTLLSAVPGWWLDAGPPDETAEFLERTLGV